MVEQWLAELAVEPAVVPVQRWSVQVADQLAAAVLFVVVFVVDPVTAVAAAVVVEVVGSAACGCTAFELD